VRVVGGYFISVCTLTPIRINATTKIALNAISENVLMFFDSSAALVVTSEHGLVSGYGVPPLGMIGHILLSLFSTLDVYEPASKPMTPTATNSKLITIVTNAGNLLCLVDTGIEKSGVAAAVVDMFSVGVCLLIRNKNGTPRHATPRHATPSHAVSSSSIVSTTVQSLAGGGGDSALNTKPLKSRHRRHRFRTSGSECDRGRVARCRFGARGVFNGRDGRDGVVVNRVGVIVRVRACVRVSS